MNYKKNKDLEGKLAEELKESKEAINIKEEFGTIPKSIMKFKKTKLLMDLIDNDENEISQDSQGQRGSGYAQKLKFSIYNPDQANFLINYYTKENDIILDPFMGRATRPIMALYNNRKYFGFDTCKATIENNIALIKAKDLENKSYVLIHGDSTDETNYTKYGIIDNYVDCVLTCPPYYDKEVYSGETGDLSHVSYKQFEHQIQQLFKILFKKIKISNYETKELYPVIFTVGSKRQGNQGIRDMDFIFQTYAKEAGFVLHDKIFTENITPGAGFTFRRNFLYKFVTKNYETTLVFMRYQ